MALNTLTVRVNFPNGEAAVILHVAKDNTLDNIVFTPQNVSRELNDDWVARRIQLEAKCMPIYLKQIVRLAQETKAPEGRGSQNPNELTGPEYLFVSASYLDLPFVWSNVKLEDCNDICTVFHAQFTRT